MKDKATFYILPCLSLQYTNDRIDSYVDRYRQKKKEQQEERGWYSQDTEMWEGIYMI